MIKGIQQITNQVVEAYCLLSQCSCFLKITSPKGRSKGNCVVLPVTCHQKYFTCISIMDKKSEEKIMVCDFFFFVDKSMQLV